MSDEADQHPSDSEDEKQRAAPCDREATKARASVKAVDDRHNHPTVNVTFSMLRGWSCRPLARSFRTAGSKSSRRWLGLFAPLATSDVNPTTDTREPQAMLGCPMQQAQHISKAAPAGSQIDTISNL